MPGMGFWYEEADRHIRYALSTGRSLGVDARELLNMVNTTKPARGSFPLRQWYKARRGLCAGLLRKPPDPSPGANESVDADHWLKLISPERGA